MEKRPIVRESMSLPKIRYSLTTACIFGAVSLVIEPLSARAADGWLDDWIHQPTMTGDWGGARTNLVNSGITPRADFIGEMAGNLSGGKNPPRGKSNFEDAFADQIRFGADLDFGRLVGWNGAYGHVTFTDRMGRSLATNVLGNKINQQEIYGQGQNFRISELSVDDTFADTLLKVKGGFFPIGNDFDQSIYRCYFESNGLCGHMPTTNQNSGWTNAPRGDWAGWVKFMPTPEYYLMVGASSVNPTYTATTSPGSTYSANGFKMDLSGATGVIVPVEVGWIHGTAPGSLPGTVKIGGYKDTSQAPDILNSKIMHTDRYGGYIDVDQALYRESPDSKRGLSALFAIGESDRATSPIPLGLQAAFIYRGTFKGRDDDTVGLGWSRYYVNQRALAGTKAGYQIYEQSVELNYGFQLSPWFLIRPGMQYVMNTGAFKESAASQNWKDAWVYETTLKITF